MDQRLRDLSHLQMRPVDQWRAAGWWGQVPLWERVKRSADLEPQRVAVVDDTNEITAKNLWGHAQSIAQALRRDGVSSGDIVLVQSPNWWEFASLVVGIEAAGAVLAFCPATWGSRETARALDLLRPAIWFVSPPGDNQLRTESLKEILELSNFIPNRIVGLRCSAGNIVELEKWRNANVSSYGALPGGRGLDPLEIAVTSGTTGDPKGVLHVHDSALATVQSTIDRQNISSHDVIHVAIPVGHTFGYFYGVRCALQASATLLLQERWNPLRAAQLIEKWRATVSLGPAACLIDLLSLPDSDMSKLGTLRLFTQSGDALPQPVAKRAATTFAFRISRALGMTEFGHAASTDQYSPPERVLDSAGSAQPGVAIEIRDADGRTLVAGGEGRVFVSGPCIFAGYVRPDRLDAGVVDANGFFETGDLGWLGEDGYLHITGREKNIIRRGAVTVPTAAVEDALAAHPFVNHAVVIGLPDARLGERPAACIQPNNNDPVPTLEDLQEHLARLGMTKAFWPSDLLIVDEWPLGPTGKIDRAALTIRLQPQK